MSRECLQTHENPYWSTSTCYMYIYTGEKIAVTKDELNLIVEYQPSFHRYVMTTFLVLIRKELGFTHITLDHLVTVDNISGYTTTLYV